jgi:quercetin dioxygenase-like cupin family protein
MKAAHAWLIGNALLCVSVVTYAVQNMESAAAAQAGKPYTINRLYTGPDGKTHAEDIAVTAVPFKLKAAGGAEIRSAPPGRVNDWHPAPRRQYVITLSGQGEIELEDGKTVRLGPGSINLAEDLTGKGHITRVIGNEPRVTLAIPVAE